jgi:hypothetical protein
MQPDEKLRKTLSQKYLAAFTRPYSEAIESGAEFLLDGHSTVNPPGRRGQPDRPDEFPAFPLWTQNPGVFPGTYTSKTYATELRKRSPGSK